MFKFLLYKFGQFCVNRLPATVAYQLASFVSDLHYLFSFRDRRAVKKNLRAILDTQENISPRAREVFRNFGRYLVEFFSMARADQQFIKDKVRFKGLENIDQALSRGKGAIFLTAHLGNWELGGVVLSLLGYPSVAIALPHKERPVNNLFNAQREARGMTIVPPSQAIRKCLSILRGNKIIAVVADRRFGASGFALDFLGRKVILPKGPAVFSLKTGAPILPIFLVREGEGRFLLEIGDAIVPPDMAHGHMPDETVFEIMRRYIPVIEQKIHQYPEQWLMFREYGFDDDAPENVVNHQEEPA